MTDRPIPDQPRNRGKVALHPEVAAGLRDGFTVTQWAFGLKLDTRVVSARLAGVMPSGTRNGSTTYTMTDALSALASPTAEQIREAILRMTARELPKGLSAAFWRGESARLDVAERKGELWSTDVVLKAMGRLIGGLNTVLKLLPDEIERAGEFSNQQRVALDNAIRSARQGMVAVLAEVSGSVPSGRADSPEPGGTDDEI